MLFLIVMLVRSQVSTSVSELVVVHSVVVVSLVHREMLRLVLVVIHDAVVEMVLGTMVVIRLN